MLMGGRIIPSAIVLSRREDETGADRDIRGNRRQISKRFGLVLHHLQDVLRLDVFVDVED